MALLEVETPDMEEETKPEQMTERVPTTMGDPIVAIAAGSVLLSWYQFYVKGDREQGLFVGLWAPTLLTLASYMQQKSIVEKFRRGISSL